MVAPESRHVVEQSFAAVRELALGAGPLRERLEGACDALLGIESAETPAALREEFKTLLGEIMSVEEAADLSDEDAAALALHILVFHERVLIQP